MEISVKEIEKSISIVKGNPNRPKDSSNRPGGLLDLSSVNKKLLVIGDLHGSIENLKAIINHENNRKEIRKGGSFVIILGDGIHNDQTGRMLEMESSLQVYEQVIRLICSYREDVIYIRGNHDTFEDRLTKSGIKQGLHFKKYLFDKRGEEYVEATGRFFETLPVFIIGAGYVITHGGPIRRGATRQELIDIVDYPDYYYQLMWNRLHEFRGTPNMKEYDEKDIHAMLEKLKLPLDTPFIVGHNPMWNTGNLTGIWRDILGIKNHIIIYSNIGTRGPYLKITGGKIESKFAISKESEKLYA